jgi:hypothetical protein
MLLRFVTSGSACAEDGWLNACKVNPYDGHKLEPQPEQVSDTEDRLHKVALVDRCYKRQKTIPGVEISVF